MLPSIGATKKKRPAPGPPPLISQPKAPNLGNYDRAAVARAVERKSSPAPIRAAVSRPQPSRPAPSPKPPPVVVPNKSGSYSRPSPPPPQRPGPIQGGGGQNNRQRNRENRQGNPGGPSKQIPKAPAPVKPGPIAQIPTAAPPPSVDEWLGTDTGYLGQQSALQQALAQFQAEQATQRTSGAATFAQRLRELQQSQQLDESDLQEDFASRGLAQSGSYADALTQLQQQYLQSQGNLQTEQTQWEGGFGSALAEFQAQQALAIQQAQAEAIARRAAQYGL